MALDSRREKLVVIGAGMASGRALETLFEADPDRFEVTLFNAEPRGNYNRLMLSPVLAGEKTYEEIVTHDDAWYEANGVDCRFGESVTRIDRERKVVVSRSGRDAPYDKLLIATGSMPFMLPLPGRDLEGVMAYRDLDDVNRMLEAAALPGAQAVVIGGGLLGLGGRCRPQRARHERDGPARDGPPDGAPARSIRRLSAAEGPGAARHPCALRRPDQGDPRTQPGRGGGCWRMAPPTAPTSW